MREIARHRGLASRSPSRLLILALTAVLILGTAAPSRAQTVTTFLFSTDNNESMQGHAIQPEEVWEFDITQPPGSEIFGPLAQTGLSMFTAGGQVDAFTWQSGIYYLSTAGNATFADNPLSIDKDDIVRYDPNAAPGSRATLFYDPDLHGSDSNVDALSFHSDGDLLVSFDANELFAGLSVLDGDIVKFNVLDPVGTRIIFFSESTFTTGNEDIIAFEFVSETEMYLTVAGDAQLPGSPVFTESEFARWDGTSGFVAVAESEFSAAGSFTLDAIARIPEPSSALLVALAGACLAFRRRARSEG